MNLESLTVNDILNLPSVGMHDKYRLPQNAAIYFIVNPPDQLLYIGQSKNVFNRLRNHEYLKNIRRYKDNKNIIIDLRIFYLDCSSIPEESRLYYEYVYISNFKPAHNKVGRIEEDIKNYAHHFFRIFSNLSFLYSKECVIKIINSYSYESKTKFNPNGGKSLKDKVLLDNFNVEFVQEKNRIIYEFYFQISSNISLDVFEEIFKDTLSKYHLPRKEALEGENIMLLTKIYFNKN